MRTRKQHNDFCESFGIDPNICDITNKWMDKPAKDGGGCSHRNKRHSSQDCFAFALKGKIFSEMRNRYLACQIHREADRKTDRCGSKSLNDSNQSIIPLFNANTFPNLRLAQEFIRMRRELRARG